MRSACEVLRYFELSGKICEKVIRLLPLNTWAPTPIRSVVVPDQASASLTSLIAPRTLSCSVRLTVSVVPPTTCGRTKLVSRERSRKVEELSASVHVCPIGSTPATSGKRAVVVFALPDEVVTRRNSGEY